jgi:biopolymer transport protein ExbD
MGNVVYLRQHGIREAQEPISNLNITPLIDVMLVLLVMLIITLPMTLHKVDVDLPVSNTPTIGEPVVQRLTLSSEGVTYWNGSAIDDAALTANLKASAAAGDNLKFQTESNARYERFNQLIAIVKQAGVKKIGFIGNGAFAKFDKLPN